MFRKNLIIHFVFIFFLFFLTNLSKADTINKVLAVVDDEIITQKDLDEFFLPLEIQLGAQYKGKDLDKKLKQARKDLLKKMIEDKLLLEEAEENNLTVSDKKVMEKFNQVKNGFSSEETFIAELKKSNMDIEGLKQRYKEQFLIDKLIYAKVKSKIKVTPAEVTEYYNEHKEDFKQGPRVKVRQIFIPKKEDNASRKIKMIQGLLNEKANFIDVASEFSKGPYADQSGLIGVVKKGGLIPEIDEVIFNLESGEISDIIVTSLGYHILKVEKKLPVFVSNSPEIRQKIRNVIFSNKARLRFKEYVKELYEKYYVSIKE